MIFFRALYYNQPFASPDNFDTLQRLRASIEKTILGGWDHFAGILIWVLLVGTAAERKSAELTFAEHLSKTCCAIGGRGAEDLKITLQKFIDVESLVEAKAARISEGLQIGWGERG